MSKRTSGLGRGLGDLLADNSPEIRGGATVIRRDGNGEVTVTPDLSDGVESAPEVEKYGKNKNNVKESAECPVKIDAIPSEDAEESRIIIGGSSQTSESFSPYESREEGDGRAETHPPHRSLKALFKSYK